METHFFKVKFREKLIFEVKYTQFFFFIAICVFLMKNTSKMAAIMFYRVFIENINPYLHTIIAHYNQVNSYFVF